MKCNICLFAAARDLADADAIELDVPVSLTAGELLDRLAVAKPALQSLLPSCRLAVNDQYVSHQAVIGEGDELALIPPVSGG